MIVYRDLHTIACSFTEAVGEAVVNGKRWRWEYTTACGIVFVRADGEELKRYPSAAHTIWPVVEQWLKDRSDTGRCGWGTANQLPGDIMSDTCAKTTYPLSEDDKARLDRDFVYHAPHGDQPKRYEWIRDTGFEFATTLLSLCPKSRELSLALTHLETACFYANAAIARNEPPPT